MGRPVLLLRLEGPLQAWGARARWDVRDTQPEPTKSGIVGLLGGALGYAMRDPRLEELDAGLRMGVRVENPGTVMDDYHTVTDFLPTGEGKYRGRNASAKFAESLLVDPDAIPATILSSRSYLQDAAFLVALEETGASPGLLVRSKDALKEPAWPAFLGRKACIPTRPILDELTDRYGGIEDALQRHPWEWRGRNNRQNRPTMLAAYVEDPDGRHIRQDAMRVNPAREYGFRHVRRLGPIARESLEAAPNPGGTP